MENICRTCLAINTQLLSVFEVEIFDEHSIKLVDFLQNLTTIKIAQGDGLPENLCLNCVEQLCKTYTFTRLCLDSDSKLKLKEVSIHETSNITVDSCKTEIIVEEHVKPEEHEVNWLLEETKTNYTFQCYNCSKVFSKKSELCKHIRSHIGFVCTHCKKQFVSQYLLDRHKLRHTKMKPFSSEERSTKKAGEKQNTEMDVDFTASNGHSEPEHITNDADTMSQPLIEDRHCWSEELATLDSRRKSPRIQLKPLSSVYDGHEEDDDESDEDFDIDNYSTDSSENLNEESRTALELPISAKNVRSKAFRRKAISCKFCNQDIITNNFSRHMKRSHSSEPEIVKILNLSNNSKERRYAFMLLRNGINFNLFLNGITRPRRQKTNKLHENSEYYPCIYCKGIFVKEYLGRHSKICKPCPDNGSRKDWISSSQTVIACAMDTTNVISKLNVKEQVFDLMRGDSVSFEAKKDVLIAYFGESYLKKHKRERTAHVCRNRMRELSRLLIAFRELTNDSTIPFKDLLRPNKFSAVVSSVRIISGYDPTTKTFKVPRLAMNLGTSLKHSCNELYRLILEESIGFTCDSEDAKQRWLSDVKNFIKLIKSRWCIELSSLATKDLSEKCNRPLSLPFTADINQCPSNIIGDKDLPEKRATAITSLQNNKDDEDIASIAKENPSVPSLSSATENITYSEQENCVNDSKKKIKKIGWSSNETKVLMEMFKTQIAQGKYPSRQEVENYQKLTNSSRTIVVIKAKLQHLMKRM